MKVWHFLTLVTIKQNFIAVVEYLKKKMFSEFICIESCYINHWSAKVSLIYEKSGLRKWERVLSRQNTLESYNNERIYSSTKLPKGPIHNSIYSIKLPKGPIQNSKHKKKPFNVNFDLCYHSSYLGFSTITSTSKKRLSALRNIPKSF